MTKRALFLDRDGILDELVFYESTHEWEAPRTIVDLQMVDGVAGPLSRIASAGWLLIIITNQPSWAKGKVTRDELLEVQNAVVAQLASAGVPIAGSYVCLHHPEASIPELRVNCDCRKPGIASLQRAAEEFGVDLTASWMVGDQDSDLLCGRAAGCRVALIEHKGSSSKRGKVEPDLRCRDLVELADALLR